MAEHTSGPWHVEVGGLLCFVYAANGDRVASCGHHLTGQDSEKASCDARPNSQLIAAAPDLLEACQAVCEAARRSNSEDRLGEEVSELLGMIGAAVRKATQHH